MRSVLRVSRAGAVAKHTSNSRHPMIHRAACRVSIAPKAIFGLFSPASAKPQSSKAKEVLNDVLDSVKSNAPAAQIAELVKQLQPLGPKAPVKDQRFFGTFKAIWSSVPTTGAYPIQIIEEPGLIKEVSEFKTLGLLSGTSTQSGELGAIDDVTYEIGFDRLEVKGGLAGQARDIDVELTVQLLYLDDEYRITQTVGTSKDALTIYRRITEGAADDDEEEEDDDAPSGSGRSGPQLFFGGNNPRESTATVAERQVRQKLAAQEAKAGGTKQTAMPSPTMKLSRPAAPAAGQDKAGKAEQDKSAAIKAALEELSDDLKEAMQATKEATAELRNVERENAAVLKQLAPAKAKLAAVADEIKEIEDAISDAGKAKAAAEGELRAAQAELAKAQSKRKAVFSRR